MTSKEAAKGYPLKCERVGSKQKAVGSKRTGSVAIAPGPFFAWVARVVLEVRGLYTQNAGGADIASYVGGP